MTLNKIALNTSSVEETEKVGKKLAQLFPRPACVAFFGEMGAGKTSLIRGYADMRVGIHPLEVSSPTFQLMHLYEGPKGKLLHFDLWRLDGEDDFISLGFQEYLVGCDVCIEWAEKISTLLPKEVIKVTVEKRDIPLKSCPPKKESQKENEDQQYDQHTRVVVVEWTGTTLNFS